LDDVTARPRELNVTVARVVVLGVVDARRSR
jgi:hypothetical protein